jgi:hypothetical protein
MDTPTNPTWDIKWSSAPQGLPTLVRIVFGGKAPDGNAPRQLAELINQAHNVGTLKSVILGFAGDNGLAMVTFVDQPDHSNPLNQWITVGLAPR